MMKLLPIRFNVFSKYQLAEKTIPIVEVVDDVTDCCFWAFLHTVTVLLSVAFVAPNRSDFFLFQSIANCCIGYAQCLSNASDCDFPIEMICSFVINSSSHQLIPLKPNVFFLQIKPKTKSCHLEQCTVCIQSCWTHLCMDFIKTDSLNEEHVFCLLCMW